MPDELHQSPKERSSHRDKATEMVPGCTKCKYTAYRPSEVIRHFKAYHMDDLDLKYVCLHEGCSFTSLQKGNIESHIIVHTGVLPYRCKFCDAAFSSKVGIWKHCGRRTKEQLSKIAEHLKSVGGSEKSKAHIPEDFDKKAFMLEHAEAFSLIRPPVRKATMGEQSACWSSVTFDEGVLRLEEYHAGRSKNPEDNDPMETEVVANSQTKRKRAQEKYVDTLRRPSKKWRSAREHEEIMFKPDAEMDNLPPPRVVLRKDEVEPSDLRRTPLLMSASSSEAATTVEEPVPYGASPLTQPKPITTYAPIVAVRMCRR